MSELFAQIVRPKAGPETPGAFLGGLRVMAVDGTVLDVPETHKQMLECLVIQAAVLEQERRFRSLRLVMLVEAGTHLIVDALMCPYRIGERVRALKLLRSVAGGMLLMWDRGLHSYAMVHRTLTTGSDYLGRVPKNVKFEVEQVLDDGSYLSWIAPDRKSKKKGATKIQVRVIEYIIDADAEPTTYRLITSLVDIAVFPALLLATEYHQRWEIENTIDQLKTHLNGRKTPIRSLKPREVVQEIYGWLLGHYAVRCLMFNAATQAGISPLRLGFTGTLKVIRRAISDFQDLQPEHLPFFTPSASPGNFRAKDSAQAGKK
jgi:hypothetical protein